MSAKAVGDSAAQPLAKLALARRRELHYIKNRRRTSVGADAGSESKLRSQQPTRVAELS